MSIEDIIKKYTGKLDHFDLQLLLAAVLKKPKEFIMIHPEHRITDHQSSVIGEMIKRRIKGEPIAYILGHKEFYGLDFAVNKHTLVPRPETEQIVELVAQNMKREMLNATIIDVGTGSGNIIVSLAHELEENTKYYGIDISAEALKVAKKNAKLNGVDKKIKFIHGNLLDPIIKEFKCYMLHATCSMIITANLPYLSKEIYNSAPIDVKKFEPKSALYSPKAGLAHYEKLLKQIKSIHASCSMLHVSCFMEISPEQKIPLTKIIKEIFPSAKIEFKKDLAGKWRICKINV